MPMMHDRPKGWATLSNGKVERASQRDLTALKAQNITRGQYPQEISQGKVGGWVSAAEGSGATSPGGRYQRATLTIRGGGGQPQGPNGGHIGSEEEAETDNRRKDLRGQNTSARLGGRSVHVGQYQTNDKVKAGGWVGGGAKAEMKGWKQASLKASRSEADIRAGASTLEVNI